MPSVLKTYQDLLVSVTKGESRSVIDTIRNRLKLREICGIRGLQESRVDTVMWNPLHFAV